GRGQQPAGGVLGGDRPAGERGDRLGQGEQVAGGLAEVGVDPEPGVVDHAAAQRLQLVPADVGADPEQCDAGLAGGGPEQRALLGGGAAPGGPGLHRDGGGALPGGGAHQVPGGGSAGPDEQ